MKAKVGINCRCGTPFKLAERFFMKDQDLQELPQAFNLMHVLAKRDSHMKELYTLIEAG